MKKTFEVVSGLLILLFMGIVLFKVISLNKLINIEPLTSVITKEESVATTTNSMINIISPAPNEVIFVPYINSELESLSYVRPTVVWQTEPALVGCNYQISLLSQGEESLLANGVVTDTKTKEGLIISEETYDPTKYYYSGKYDLKLTVECPIGHPLEGSNNDSFSVFYKRQEATEPSTVPHSEKTIDCTADAKICSDGSFVSRTGPNCEFAACPTEQVSPEVHYCSETSRNVECEIARPEPVCAQVEVQCIPEPCDPVSVTYQHSCYACSDGNAISYMDGSCEIE